MHGHLSPTVAALVVQWRKYAIGSVGHGPPPMCFHPIRHAFPMFPICEFATVGLPIRAADDTVRFSP